MFYVIGGPVQVSPAVDMVVQQQELSGSYPPAAVRTLEFQGSAVLTDARNSNANMDERIRVSSDIVPDERFRIVQAQTPEDMEKVLKVRKEAYCEDHDFETVESEDDGVNPFSSHAYIAFRGTPVGVSRLTLGRQAPELLFLKHCTERPDDELISSMGELGRFACSRKAKEEVGLSNRKRDSLPLILYNLKAALTMSAAAQISVWGMLIDVRLRDCIQFFGGVLPVVGPRKKWPSHSKFWRVPCIVGIREFSDHMMRKEPGLWDFLTDYGELMRRIPSD